MGNIMDMPLWCWKDDDVIWLRLRPILPTLSETFETGVKKNNYVAPLKTRERQKKIRINSFFL